MKNNNILKMLANKAKNRLINKNLRNTYSNVDIKIITRNDDNFYNKVKEIMDEKTYVCNPLKRLDQNFGHCCKFRFLRLADRQMRFALCLCSFFAQLCCA